MAFHAVIIGIIFAKSQRGVTRGHSIAYSKKCLVRFHDGQPYFIFLCGDKEITASGELTFASILYADEVCPAVTEPVQALATNEDIDDDELGGMLLLLFPNRVIHHIDAWSPLLPVSLRNPEGGTPMNSYRYPQIRLRAMDAMQGNRAVVESKFTESFSTESAFNAHRQRRRLNHRAVW